MIIECLHPNIFVNPALPQLLATYRQYFLDGRYFTWYFQDEVLQNRKFLKRFYRLKHLVNLDNIDNYYVLDDAGYKYPIFLASKCNHCILCTEASHNVYASRLLAESQLYDTRPMFVTLTYNDYHLPVDGVSVRDCQLFLKRFRQSLIRKFNYYEKVRYFLVSEYGQDERYTHRPHYHAIFFNLPNHSSSDTWQIRDLMRSSWHNGNIQCRVIDMKKPTCFYYTSKYLYKDQQVPDGKNKPFSLSSRRYGGIGSAFFRQFRDLMFREKLTSLQYCDKFSGAIRQIPLSHYVMKYILPTFCESVPYSFRESARQFNIIYSAHSHLDEIRLFFGEFHNKLVSKLSPYISLEKCLFPSKKPNLNFVHFALSSIRDEISSFLDSTDFLTLKLIEYARKDVFSKLASSLMPLLPQALLIKANNLQIKRNYKQSKKLLHVS